MKHVQIGKPKKNQYGEWKVSVMIDGRYSEQDSYYANDKEDANDTRIAMYEVFKKLGNTVTLL